MQAATGADHARFEGIHIKVADQNGAVMAFVAFRFVDHARQLHRLEYLAFTGEAHFAGQMSGGDKQALAPGHFQPPDRYAMALEQRPEEARVETGKEDKVAAIAPSVLIVGGIGIQFFEKLFLCDAALGKDEHIGDALACQVADEAGNLAPVQIPEEELRHRGSFEFPVSSCKGNATITGLDAG